jgi:hypothetical protein
VDIGVRDDDHEKGSRATSTTVGRSNMEFDRTSVDSSAHATRSNAGSFSDVYSDVSGTWQDDAAAQVPTSKSGRQLSQLAQVEQGHAILVRPDEQKASVDVHESVATRILEALIRSDDERSAFLLANLRVGLSWREMAAHLAQSDEGRHYDLSQTMRTNLKRQDPGSSHDVEYRNRARSTHLASTVTNISNGSDTSLMSWLKSSFDLSYWMRDRHDRQGQKVAASVGKAEYITFAKSWNRHFGNLDLANAIEANNYSRAQQDLQKGNLSAPIWAMRLMNYHDMSDPFSQAIANIYQECEAAGDIEVFCGPHAYIEAVADEAAYNIAPKLSQHLARLIKGIRPDDPRPSGLHYALLTAFWALLNWSLRPSKTSYDEIPAYLRPSPWQYFVVHSHIVDFTTSLLQREYLCRTSDADMSWVVEGSRTVECDFPQNIPWFERDSKSGHIVLSAECKVSVTLTCSSGLMT